jgi:transcriptional regulator with GAF, ATPase, and Fis domain
VGSDKDIAVDVRVVAATNKNLREEIAEGRFREDLYHRLSVIIIHVPPLREREGDIPLLTDHFATTICNDYGITRKHISGESVEALCAMPWTGNIRELRNVIERLIILGGDQITVDDVHAYVSEFI